MINIETFHMILSQFENISFEVNIKKKTIKIKINYDTMLKEKKN